MKYLPAIAAIVFTGLVLASCQHQPSTLQLQVPEGGSIKVHHPHLVAEQRAQQWRYQLTPEQYDFVVCP